MVALLLIMLLPSSQEVASEVDIFGALTDVFRETDPAVVMGYAGTPAVTLATVHPACLEVGMSQSDAEWEHKRIMQYANSVGIRRTAAARGGRSKPRAEDCRLTTDHRAILCQLQSHQPPLYISLQFEDLSFRTLGI